MMGILISEKEAAHILDQLPCELAAARKACFIAGFRPPLPYTLNDDVGAIYAHADVMAEYLRRARK